MMTDEDHAQYSSPPDLEKVDNGIEGDAEKEYQKARDKNLPLSERGGAFMRICEVASRTQGTDTNRKAALEHVIQLFPELGTEKSANILAELLFDISAEIRKVVLVNIFAFVQKTDNKNFEAVIYYVVEELAATNGRPSITSNEESEALGAAAKHLMKTYSAQFFSALFVSSSVSKGSLKWLAASYPKLKSEIFNDGSEAGANADRVLMAALKSASSQLTDTIDKAMLAMDAMNRVTKTVQSVLGVYSDLLRVSGEPGIVIVGTALTFNAREAAQEHQARMSETTHSGYHRGHAYSHDSGASQISPMALPSGNHPFSSEAGLREAVPLASGRRCTSEVGMTNSAGAPASPQAIYAVSATISSTPTVQNQRSSSAPPTPGPSKRTFEDTKTASEKDSESKRVKKDEGNPAIKSPGHDSKKLSNAANQDPSGDAYRENSSRGRYQGKNFIQGFNPNHRGWGGYHGREVYRSSYPIWRGGRTQRGGRRRGGDYQGSYHYRSSEYPSRMSYD